MDTNGKPGWSVMGTGTIATEHMVAAIRAVDHHPLWVVSRNRNYAADFSQDMAIPHTSVDALQALRDPRVGYCYVSAARKRRKHYIMAAAAEGKHVLCDGPIATNSTVGAKLVDACRQAGIILALNQPLRASSPHQTMRRLVQEGDIGEVKSLLVIRGMQFQPPPNRHPGDEPDKAGGLFELTVETADLARYLTGEEPVAVSALSGVDQHAYSMRLSGGAIFQAFESFAAAEFESLVILAGDRGTLIANGTLGGRGSGTLTRRLGNRSELVPVRERDLNIETVKAFLSLPRQERTWMALAEDNLIALRAAEAVRAAQNRRGVQIQI